MKRRAFVAAAAAPAAAALRAPARARAQPAEAAAPPAGGRVVTVTGEIHAAEMGTTLVHEHVLVDFGGAAVASPSRYDAEQVFRVALPQLQELARRGCRTLVECTPAYLGRDPRLLARLSRASGVRILTNTGYYGAAKDLAVPGHAYTESARQLAERWTAEARRGIEGTGIRPGFVKIGVDPGALSEIDRKLVEAAALCHLATGLTLAIHTGDGSAALGIVDVLRGAGVSPEAWIWVHAGNARDRPSHDWAARQGAWLEFDKLGEATLAEHVEAVLDLSRRGHLGRLLVSHDAGWYHVGEPGGGAYRPYTFLFDRLVPALRQRGFGDQALHRLLVENPARAFAVAVRRQPAAPRA